MLDQAMIQGHDVQRLLAEGTYARVCEDHLAELDTIYVFDNHLGVFGGGTRLAMPKTICPPDSSSLKPGSGATEGVLD